MRSGAGDRSPNGGGTMRRLLIGVAATMLVAGACTAGGSDSSSSNEPVTASSNVSHDPVTLTMWVHFSGRELKTLDSIIADFHKQYPWITVNTVGAKNEQETLQAINSG